MERSCRQCAAPFEITQDALTFLDTVSPVFAGKKELIPPPTLCPPCRSQRRLAFRNERTLYRRTCDLTGVPVVSVYPPDQPFPVYETTAWYTDGWDPLSYGRDVDFSRPFFEQFHELKNRVPRLSLAVIKNENCPYVNQVWNAKNCYLCIDGGFLEDALYCHATYHAKDVLDCSSSRYVEVSADLVDCNQCYHCLSLVDCKNCTDAYYSIDCQQCTSIAFCSNLRGKKYCIFNREVSKEEWETMVQTMLGGSQAQRTEHMSQFAQLLPHALRRATHNIQCEQCTGDYLQHSRRCADCYDGDECQDLRYCSKLDERVVSSVDIDHGAILELAYEGLTLTGNHIAFMHASYSPSNHDLYYCDLAISSSDCFGCVGIRNGKYCILNKKYTRREYELLVPRIIAHMRTTGEWGEFFPVTLSPYAYNETVAQDPEYFPLTKDEVQRRGWRWRERSDEVAKADRLVPAGDLPDRIDDTPDEILGWAIQCAVTKRPFKIIRQELDFYRRMKLPLPRLHPDERYRLRAGHRNPRQLWQRPCTQCGTQMLTTYAPARPETVYCEECYRKTVY